MIALERHASHSSCPKKKLVSIVLKDEVLKNKTKNTATS